MGRYVAFLRGIGLGKRRPPMAQLKTLFEQMGFDDVATFIASGNVVFGSSAKDRAKLEARISKHLHDALGYEVESFVRTADEVRGIGRMQPFADPLDGVTTVQVCLMHEPMPADVSRKLRKVKTPTDEFAVEGRDFYWLCRVKINESTIWQHPAMKSIPLPSFTMRNMTSIRKLIAQRLT